MVLFIDKEGFFSIVMGLNVELPLRTIEIKRLTNYFAGKILKIFFAFNSFSREESHTSFYYFIVVHLLVVVVPKDFNNFTSHLAMSLN